MKDRIFYLRKTVLGMSRDAFGSAIGMSGSEIRNIENGVTTLKEHKIPLLCSQYNVRAEWLLSGKGEIFSPKTRGQEIGEIVREAASVDPEQAVEFFQQLLADMSDAEIVLLYSIFKRHFKG